jgi:hypothetical protein
VPISYRLPALLNCTLQQHQGIWTLFIEHEEYMRLLDAESYADAEEQVAAMLLQSIEARLARPLA